MESEAAQWVRPLVERQVPHVLPHWGLHCDASRTLARKVSRRGQPTDMHSKMWRMRKESSTKSSRVETVLADPHLLRQLNEQVLGVDQVDMRVLFCH